MTIIPVLLLTALIQVESGGNDRALGDYANNEPTAFGCLQISDKVLADVRRLTGRWVSRSDVFDRRKACQICLVYLSHYATTERLGHEPTVEDLARIWNGGPSGWNKPETLLYWHKVERELHRQGYVKEPPTSRAPAILFSVATVR